MTDSPSIRYDRTAKILHWVIAALVILLLFGGNLLEELPDAEKPALAMVHSGIGLSILTLMLIRLYWRLGHPPPAPVAGPAWQHLAARIAHWAFYVLVILQPIWGFVQSMYTSFEVSPFGLFTITGADQDPDFFEIFHELHELTASLIILILVIHVIAALYHHFARKDVVLKRMSWGKLNG